MAWPELTASDTAPGGGGGAFARISNIAWTAAQTCAIGGGGPGGSTSGATGTSGGNTWARIDGGATAPTTTTQGVLAAGSVAGTFGQPGAGGTTAASVGTTTNAGGTGGTTANNGYGSSGGGGAAGPGGAGANGGNDVTNGVFGAGAGGGANGGGSAGSANTATASTGANGGNSITTGNQTATSGGTGGAANTAGNPGSNGSGGGGGGDSSTAGAAGNGGAGGAGAEYDASHGSGGGGGGGGGDPGTGSCGSGGAGGNFGGGGGGGGVGNLSFGAGGNGAPGILVISYTPSAGTPITWGFNQPPAAFPRRIRPQAMRGDDGAIAVLVPPPAQPIWEVGVNDRQGKRNIRLLTDHGDDGLGLLLPFVQIGWPIQSWQPIHPRPERFGALVAGDVGTQAPKALIPVGWEPRLPETLHPRPERSGALARGDDGTEALFARWFNAGWEVQLPQPKIVRARYSAQPIDVLTSLISAPLANLDFSVLWQPFIVRHRITDHGWNIPTPLIPPPAGLLPVELSPQWQPVQFPMIRQRGAVAGGKSSFASSSLSPFSWDEKAHQPQHPRPERAGAIARGDDGIEGIRIVWTNDGWEIQPPQPPHPRRERAGSIMAGDTGTEAPFVPPAFVFPQWGHAFLDPMIKRYIRMLPDHDDGIAAPFQRWPFVGFEQTAAITKILRPRPADVARELMLPLILPPLPTIDVSVLWQPVPFPKVRQRGTALAGRSSFAAFSLLPFTEVGAPLLRRRIGVLGAMTRAEDILLVPAKAAAVMGWEFQPTGLRVARRSVETRYDVLLPPAIITTGWDFQPASLRAARHAADFRTDVFAPAAFYPPDLSAPWQPPRAIRRLSLLGDIGPWDIEHAFVPPGWPVQPWQPPHPRPERAGGIMAGDFGAWAPFVPPPKVLASYGWDAILHQPRHPRFELAAGIMIGDVGSWAPFIYLVPSAARARDRAVFEAVAFDIGVISRSGR